MTSNSQQWYFWERYLKNPKISNEKYSQIPQTREVTKFWALCWALFLKSCAYDYWVNLLTRCKRSDLSSSLSSFQGDFVASRLVICPIPHHSSKKIKVYCFYKTWQFVQSTMMSIWNYFTQQFLPKIRPSLLTGSMECGSLFLENFLVFFITWLVLIHSEVQNGGWLSWLCSELDNFFRRCCSNIAVWQGSIFTRIVTVNFSVAGWVRRKAKLRRKRVWHGLKRRSR